MRQQITMRQIMSSLSPVLATYNYSILNSASEFGISLTVTDPNSNPISSGDGSHTPIVRFDAAGQPTVCYVERKQEVPYHISCIKFFPAGPQWQTYDYINEVTITAPESDKGRVSHFDTPTGFLDPVAPYIDFQIDPNFNYPFVAQTTGGFHTQLAVAYYQTFWRRPPAFQGTTDNTAGTSSPLAIYDLYPTFVVQGGNDAYRLFATHRNPYLNTAPNGSLSQEQQIFSYKKADLDQATAWQVVASSDYGVSALVDPQQVNENDVDLTTSSGARDENGFAAVAYSGFDNGNRDIFYAFTTDGNNYALPINLTANEPGTAYQPSLANAKTGSNSKGLVLAYTVLNDDMSTDIRAKYCDGLCDQVANWEDLGVVASSNFADAVTWPSVTLRDKISSPISGQLEKIGNEDLESRIVIAYVNCSMAGGPGEIHATRYSAYGNVRSHILDSFEKTITKYSTLNDVRGGSDNGDSRRSSKVSEKRSRVSSNTERQTR